MYGPDTYDAGEGLKSWALQWLMEQLITENKYKKFTTNDNGRKSEAQGASHKNMGRAGEILNSISAVETIIGKVASWNQDSAPTKRFYFLSRLSRNWKPNSLGGGVELLRDNHLYDLVGIQSRKKDLDVLDSEIRRNENLLDKLIEKQKSKKVNKWTKAN